MKQINKAALKVVIEGTQSERLYLCERDFSLFFCYYAIDYIKYPFADFHFDFFDDVKKMMDGTYHSVAWIAFRESAKTSFAKMFLMWLICYKKRAYINVDSFDKENAERILFDVVVELQTNPRLLMDFGELYNVKRNDNEVTQKRINNFITNNGVRVEAHSTQESVRGRIHGHQRPDFLLLDDFETNKTKDSEAYTAQVMKHIDEFRAGLDSNAIILYLGNYITEYGTVQSLMDRAKEDPRFMLRNIPVIVDGLPVWPAKYSLTAEEGKIALDEKRRQLGSQVFNVEMMNMPIDELNQEFSKNWFKYVTWDEVRRKPTRKFVTIDPAFTKKEESDYTGICKNYVDNEDNWYLDATHKKLNTTDLIGLIFTLYGEGFEKIGIEEGAFTEMIVPFFQKECQERRVYPYVVPLKHGGTMKETRIRGLIPRYEQGKIYHIEGRCDALEDELLRFPNSRHDDVCDAVQYQLKIAEQYYDELKQEEYKLYVTNFS